MQTNTIIEHLRAVLSEIEDFRPRIAIEAIAPDHRLVEDLGIDSVALLDLAVGLEARLGRAVDETELVRLSTVGAVAAHFAREA